MNERIDGLDQLFGFDASFGKRWLNYVKSELKGFDEYQAYHPIRIENWPDGVEFYYQGKPTEDVLPGGFYWLLVSDRFRSVMENNHIQGVQYLPVKVLNSKTGKSLGIYWVIHLLVNIESLDRELIKDLDIFRLKNTSFWISDRLKGILEAAQVTSGASFYPVVRRSPGRR